MEQTLSDKKETIDDAMKSRINVIPFEKLQQEYIKKINQSSTNEEKFLIIKTDFFLINTNDYINNVNR